MFKHILVPLDGSDVAEVVLPIAKSLGKELGARVTLVRVVDVGAITRSVVPSGPDVGGFSGEAQKVIDETEAAELQDATAYLSKISADFVADKVEVNTEVREGSAGDEILAAIETEGVDVAAVATHGRSGISRTFFGSVADKLIRESGKPVLVVKAG